MAVSAAHEHHFSKHARIENPSRFLQGSMISVIESDPNLHPGSFGFPKHRVQFCRAPGSWLLDQDMLATSSGNFRNRSKLIVCSSDNYDLNFRMCCRSAPISQSLRPREAFR